MRALAFAFFVLGGCYSMTPQDQAAFDTNRRLVEGAECNLEQVPLDAGPWAVWVGRARADLRPARAEAVGALRRNGVDAGADQAPPCPPGSP